MKSQVFAVCVLLALIAVQGVMSSSRLERDADKAEEDFKKSLKSLLDSANRVATNMFGSGSSRACGMRISQQAAGIAATVHPAIRACKVNSNQEEKFNCVIREATNGKSSCTNLMLQLIRC